MFDLLKVVILGIVEGITEWLPISSTGHMLLLYRLFDINEQDACWSMFLAVIQRGAILAVVVMYFSRLWPFKLPDPKAQGAGKLTSMLQMPKIVMWLKIAVSCIPAVILGLTLDDWMEAHLYNYIVVAVMLIVYGVLFILVENRNRTRKPSVRKIGQISFRLALIIGVFQALAIIPGTSRSGATILGGILLGMSRRCASEYTFFLAIPTMFGASLLKVIKFAAGGASMTGMQWVLLGVGMAVAFAVSIAAIKFLIGYIRQHDFKAFGIYRIGLGVVVLLFFAVSSLFV